MHWNEMSKRSNPFGDDEDSSTPILGVEVQQESPPPSAGPIPDSSVLDKGKKFATTLLFSSEYHDKWFAIIFIAQLITTMCIGMVTAFAHGASLYFTIPRWVMGSSVISFALCWGVLKLIKKHAEIILFVGQGMTVLLSLTSAAVSSIKGFYFISGLMATISVLAIIWIISIRGRIKFAGAVLSSAIQIIELKSATLLVSYFMFFLVLLYTFLWSYYISLFYEKHSLFYIFLALLQLYWTTQVFSNITVATAAGVVSEYFSDKETATFAIFQECVSVKLGSICLGSLFTAVIQTANMFVRYFILVKNSTLRMIVARLLDFLEKSMKYFNSYAFVHISMYRMSYFSASRKSFQLLKECGLLAIINDGLVMGVLFWTNLLCGLSAGTLVGVFSGRGSTLLLSCLVGWVSASLTNVVVHAAVICIFIHYAEFGDQLKARHPEIFYKVNSEIKQSDSDMEMS